MVCRVVRVNTFFQLRGAAAAAEQAQRERQQAERAASRGRNRRLAGIYSKLTTHRTTEAANLQRLARKNSHNNNNNFKAGQEEEDDQQVATSPSRTSSGSPTVAPFLLSTE